jgi:hypothetical protein
VLPHLGDANSLARWITGNRADRSERCTADGETTRHDTPVARHPTNGSCSALWGGCERCFIEDSCPCPSVGQRSTC